MENIVYLRPRRLVEWLAELASSHKRSDPVEKLLDMLSQKCALRLIAALQAGEARFNTLVRHSGGTANTVRVRLSELAEAGIVERTVLSQMPPSVSFQLTERGMELANVLAGLFEWEVRWRASAPPTAAVSIAAEATKPYRPV